MHLQAVRQHHWISTVSSPTSFDLPDGARPEHPDRHDDRLRRRLQVGGVPGPSSAA